MDINELRFEDLTKDNVKELPGEIITQAIEHCRSLLVMHGLDSLHALNMARPMRILMDENARRIHLPTWGIPHCPVCNKPAHASESDDYHRHAHCQGDER